MQIGIDLGGTKIEAVLIDPNGVEVARHRSPTPSGNYSKTLDAIAALVNTLQKNTNTQASVGIGTPGSIGPDGLLRNCNSTCLNGKPFAEDLKRTLKQEIRIENDANCFTLSESVDGAAADYKTVFGVILGTGVGGGLVTNNKLLVGRNRIAGEWGHNILYPDGPQCWCGNYGCIETIIAGPSLIKQWQGNKGPENAIDLCQLADQGNPQASQIMERFFDNVGLALASVINILDPDAIVIGGGLSNIASIYDKVPISVEKYVFSNHFDTPILQNQHGDSSGVRGAAWLWGSDELTQ